MAIFLMTLLSVVLMNGHMQCRALKCSRTGNPITTIKKKIFSCLTLCLHTLASPASFVAFPQVYGSSPVINPSTPGCDLYRGSDFQCNYTVILGDGVMVPSPPDLNSEDYFKPTLC